MPQEPQTTVAILEKNRDEEIRVLLGEFKGKQLCHVRTFLRRVDGVEREDPLPTKKGVTVKIEQLPELIAALETAYRSICDAPRAA